VALESRAPHQLCPQSLQLVLRTWIYDLCHQPITNWLGEGQSPVHVRDAAAHPDMRTTVRYAHLHGNLSDLAAKVPSDRM
jgi:hypothetical protein